MGDYRLAWPIFDNGLSIVAVHGFSTTGKDAWMRMVGKDGRWLAVTDVRERIEFEDDDITMRTGEWQVTDAEGEHNERSEEGCVGQEGGRTGRIWWGPVHKKKKT